jgi:hypothetical protein
MPLPDEFSGTASQAQFDRAQRIIRGDYIKGYPPEDIKLWGETATQDEFNSAWKQITGKDTPTKLEVSAENVNVNVGKDGTATLLKTESRTGEAASTYPTSNRGALPNPYYNTPSGSNYVPVELIDNTLLVEKLTEFGISPGTALAIDVALSSGNSRLANNAFSQLDSEQKLIISSYLPTDVANIIGTLPFSRVDSTVISKVNSQLDTNLGIDTLLETTPALATDTVQVTQLDNAQDIVAVTDTVIDTPVGEIPEPVEPTPDGTPEPKGGLPFKLPSKKEQREEAIHEIPQKLSYFRVSINGGKFKRVKASTFMSAVTIAAVNNEVRKWEVYKI